MSMNLKTSIRIDLDDRKMELESKRRNSNMQEQDLSVKVTRMIQKQKSNEQTYKRLSSTLEVKKPTYAQVKIEATKNDTLYNKLKTTFAAKVSLFSYKLYMNAIRTCLSLSKTILKQKTIFFVTHVFGYTLYFLLLYFCCTCDLLI